MIELKNIDREVERVADSRLINTKSIENTEVNKPAKKALVIILRTIRK